MNIDIEVVSMEEIGWTEEKFTKMVQLLKKTENPNAYKNFNFLLDES